MGDDLRGKYHDISCRMLVTVLARRRCPVLVTKKVTETWLAHYGIPVLKRPAQSVSVACKRPAASVSANSAPSAKRRRTDVSDGSAEVSLTVLNTVLELEHACGHRYRREYTDLGLGMQGQGDMVKILASWGYSVKAFVCRSWLGQYRLEGAQMQGNAAVFGLSRTDLRRWYYVEKLTPTQLQERYMNEHGVYAHHQRLVEWLRAPAQALERLERDIESMHQHACGEYILEQLQTGSFLGGNGTPHDTRN